MLTIATTISSVVLLSLTVLQAIYVYRYQAFLKNGLANERKRHDLKSAPSAKSQGVRDPAALILCLRGLDPTLSDCLAGIVGQDYPDMQLHVVFDHPDDPAVAYVEEFFEDTPIQPITHVVSDPYRTCSLKCSSLITVVESLPESVELVALIDADTVADPRWLIDLLAPFSDPTVGATTGNRWFTPKDSSIGSVFRKIWNAAAVPQVTLYNIGWGGSLAFRRDVLVDAGLLDGWKTAFCEDTMVAEMLKPAGLKMQRVASLIMENTESTALGDAFRWITRQTLTVRLHHSSWPLVLAHAFLTAVACYAVPVLIAFAALIGDFGSVRTLTQFFLVYQLINIGLLFVINRCNQTIVASRSTDGLEAEIDQSSVWKTLLAIVLNQYLFPIAVYRAWTTKSVHWRGIEYFIDAQNRLEMKAYVPYREVLAEAGTQADKKTTASIH